MNVRRAQVSRGILRWVQERKLYSDQPVDPTMKGYFSIHFFPLTRHILHSVLQFAIRKLNVKNKPYRHPFPVLDSSLRPHPNLIRPQRNLIAMAPSLTPRLTDLCTSQLTKAPRTILITIRNLKRRRALLTPPQGRRRPATEHTAGIRSKRGHFGFLEDGRERRDAAADDSDGDLDEMVDEWEPHVVGEVHGVVAGEVEEAV
jgi:hypothetical protein